MSAIDELKGVKIGEHLLMILESKALKTILENLVEALLLYPVINTQQFTMI